MPLKIYNTEIDNPSANINTLADKIGVTPRWLYEQTLKETGKSPHEYLEALRLNAALPLLAAGEALASVSNKVGYCHTKTFAQAFKRRFGIPPGKWAKENPRAQQPSQLIEKREDFRK